MSAQAVVGERRRRRVAGWRRCCSHCSVGRESRWRRLERRDLWRRDLRCCCCCCATCRYERLDDLAATAICIQRLSNATDYCSKKRERERNNINTSELVFERFEIEYYSIDIINSPHSAYFFLINFFITIKTQSAICRP